MSIDPEIDAMSKVYAALQDLEDDQRQRVLDWISSKLGLTVKKASKQQKVDDSVTDDTNTESDLECYDTVADLFSLATVKTEPQKVLLVAAFLQKKLEKTELTSKEINDELKNLGHKVSNITSAVNGLLNRKPQLMIQTRKEGVHKQAQKKFKVTVAGFKEAKKLISHQNEE